MITTEQRQQLVRIMTAKADLASAAKTEMFYIWCEDDGRMMSITPDVWRDRMIALVDEDPERFERIVDAEWWTVETIERIVASTTKTGEP